MTDRLKELQRRRKIALQMGGNKNIDKQHSRGKMTVRERIDVLSDADSFIERGMLAGVAQYDKEDPNKLIDLTPCPTTIGLVEINGQTVAVQGDDFTIKGASVGKMYKAKNAYFVKMARTFKVPIVRLVEGAGGSIKEILDVGYTELPTMLDEGTQDQVEALSEVPIASAGFGAIAGIAALYMVHSHFSVMVKEKAQVFVGGPPLVKAAFGEEYTKEELGGYKIHCFQTGVVDNVAEDEEDAINQIKRFLSYLPPNVWEMPKRIHCDDDPERSEEELISIIPRNRKKPYNMWKILNHIFDHGSIFEIGKFQGRSQITALARMNGYPVGILANDTRFFAGAFDYDVGEKFQRFIDMCDTFHLPIINISDQPGFAIGKKSELQGTIRKGVRASFAIIQATVPLAVMYVRRSFGVAGSAQKSGIRLSWLYAWPSAVWGNIPIEGGVHAAHRREIETAENPEDYVEELHKTYRAISSPFRTAEHFGIEDIIDPRETRPLLCRWVKMAYEVEKHNLGVKKRGMRM